MSSRNNQHGFTLIEVLVAVVILAFGFVGIAQALGRTQDVLRISHNLIHASFVAEQRLSEVEMELRERMKLSSSSLSGEDRFSGNGFRWAKSIFPYTGEEIEDQTRINRVDIAVTWNDGPGRKNQETLSSILVNRDKKDEI